MICKSCGCPVDEHDLHETFDRVPYGDGYVDMPSGNTCPRCGDDDLCEAAECSCCGEYVDKDSLDCSLCDSCTEDLYKTLKEFWNALSPAQKEWTGEHCDDWMEG